MRGKVSKFVFFSQTFQRFLVRVLCMLYVTYTCRSCSRLPMYYRNRARIFVFLFGPQKLRNKTSEIPTNRSRQCPLRLWTTTTTRSRLCRRRRRLFLPRSRTCGCECTCCVLKTFMWHTTATTTDAAHLYT